MAPPPILRTQDELLEEIFFLLTTVSDLASASAACVPFRRLITDHGFLRRYRALHPPPLIGMLDLDDGTLAPAQPPHLSAVAACAFAGFDFSCKSFLPTKSGRAWLQLDFLDGRALLTGVLESDLEAMVFNRRQLLFSDIAVCDPVHRCYVLLPAVPSELTALVPKHDLLGLEAFLAPGDDEEDPLSFRVMCLAKRGSNMVLLVFSSSLGGQWHSFTFDQYQGRLFGRQLVRGYFCWCSPFLKKLLLLDIHSMELSAVSLPPEQRESDDFVFLETAQGMLGVLTIVDGGDNEDGRTLLKYSILRNKQWHLEKFIPTPMEHIYMLGVAGGYVLLATGCTIPSQGKRRFFSVDVKTLQVELFGEGSLGGELYAGFRPSLCAPTI
ncbi:hypothetical protein D1007_13297 [Hordeum vulgare]|nr:hypothetical protein D1007_13297 [Hordeum vulgare]